MYRRTLRFQHQILTALYLRVLRVADCAAAALTRKSLTFG